MGARGGGHLVCLSQKGEGVAIHYCWFRVSYQEGWVVEKGTGKVSDGKLSQELHISSESLICLMIYKF